MSEKCFNTKQFIVKKAAVSENHTYNAINGGFAIVVKPPFPFLKLIKRKECYVLSLKGHAGAKEILLMSFFQYKRHADYEN